MDHLQASEGNEMELTCVLIAHIHHPLQQQQQTYSLGHLYCRILFDVDWSTAGPVLDYSARMLSYTYKYGSVNWSSYIGYGISWSIKSLVVLALPNPSRSFWYGDWWQWSHFDPNRFTPVIHGAGLIGNDCSVDDHGRLPMSCSNNSKTNLETCPRVVEVIIYEYSYYFLAYIDEYSYYFLAYIDPGGRGQEAVRSVRQRTYPSVSVAAIYSHLKKTN